jgi:hypothetical protein
MMDLKEFVNNVAVSSLDIVFGNPGWEGQNYLETEPYYKWLASYVRLVKPKAILELGRREGNSLFALSKFLPDESTLHSFDIKECGNVVKKSNVSIEVYDGNYTKLNLNQYDFIFVDINGGGQKEYEIFQQMLNQGYKGLTAWDDVQSEHCKPEFFWNRIDYDKVLTNYNNSGSGFGFILI